MRPNILPATLILLFFLAPVAQTAVPQPVSNYSGLTQAINGTWRTPAFVKRDRYRHPLKVLKFFQIKPNLTVLELNPGQGWWTEILAPYLKPGGQLIEAVPPSNAKSASAQRMHRRFSAKMKADPGLYSKVLIIPFAPPAQKSLGTANSVDRVLTFRNLHNWKNRLVLPEVFRAAYRVLKPGGIFGLVAHRALPSAEPDLSSAKLHRLAEDYVIALALKTGFRLSGVAEVNANRKDPLTLNVHGLQPDLKWGDTPAQQAVYKKIGESDRMTLRFIKP